MARISRKLPFWFGPDFKPANLKNGLSRLAFLIGWLVRGFMNAQKFAMPLPICGLSPNPPMIWRLSGLSIRQSAALARLVYRRFIFRRGRRTSRFWRRRLILCKPKNCALRRVMRLAVLCRISNVGAILPDQRIRLILPKWCLMNRAIRKCGSLINRPMPKAGWKI